MTNDELEILDLSHLSRGEWVPPVSATGGPRAHELYRDLVTHAGMRLLRDENSSPWLELQDGAHRRAFPVPSLELREAIDRFRLRRNLSPVPEEMIREFTRVVEARVSDPDVTIPLLAPNPPAPPEPASPASADKPATAGPKSWAVDELDQLMHEVDAIQGRAPPAPEAVSGSPVTPGSLLPPAIHRRIPHRWHTAVSSARGVRVTNDPRLPRYVRVLRELVQDGTWIGSLAEIARRTGDDTSEVFSTLLQFHTDLVGNDLVVAPVEVEDGWRWVVVDRARLRPSSDADE